MLVLTEESERGHKNYLAEGVKKELSWQFVNGQLAVDLFHIYRGVLSEIFPFKRYFIEVRQVCLVSIIVHILGRDAAAAQPRISRGSAFVSQ